MTVTSINARSANPTRVPRVAGPRPASRFAQPHKGEPAVPSNANVVRRSRAIVNLLDRHSELRGVHAMADLLDESVRWTA